MIPRIIHYCWFGNSEMPAQYHAYINEWKALMPDWEIKRWDETNSPMTHPYIKKAIKNKKWTNISNFIRLHALKVYGGIYMDTDMKVLRPLDHFLNDGCFLGFEEGNENSETFWVNNAIMGAEKNHPFAGICFKALLDLFDGSEVPNESGPRLATRVLKEQRGLKTYGFQKLKDVVLYPTVTFYPICYEDAYKTKKLNIADYPESYAIHMWGRTWLSNDFLIKIIDEKQELIANQRNEISAALVELKSTDDTIKKLREEYTLLVEINLNNEKTKKSIDQLHEEVLGELGLTSEKIHASHHSLQRLFEEKHSDSDSKLSSISEAQELLQNNLTEQLTLANSKLTTLENIQRILTKQDDLDKNITNIVSHLHNTQPRLQVIDKIESIVEKILEETGEEIQSQTRLIGDVVSSLTDTNKTLSEANLLQAEKLLKLQNDFDEFKTNNGQIFFQKEKELNSLSLDKSILENEKIQLLNELKSKALALNDNAASTLNYQKEAESQRNEKQVLHQILLENTESGKKKDLTITRLNENLENIKLEFERSKSLFKEETARHHDEIQKLGNQNKTLHQDIEEKTHQLQESRLMIQRLNDKLDEYSKELSKSKTAQEDTNKEILSALYKEIQQKKEAVAWYIRTYEKRNLLGIIKDRVLRH
jgi:mannosyltransferase OCH1-like enzyme